MLCYFCDTELPETTEICHICGGKQINYAPHDSVEDEDLSATDKDLPAADEDLTATDKDLPAADKELPAADEDLPATDKDLPAADEDLPAADEDLPAADEDLPATDKDLSATDKDLPAADEDLSATDKEQIPKAAKHSGSDAEPPDDKTLPPPVKEEKPGRNKQTVYIQTAVKMLTDKPLWVYITAAAVIAALCTASAFLFFIPNAKYNKAQRLLSDGEFTAAKELFSEIHTFRNAGVMIYECDYQNALFLLQTGSFDKAAGLFAAVSPHNDSEEMVLETYYQKALYFMENNRYTEAAALFEQLSSYKNSSEMFKESILFQARSLLDRQDFEQAKAVVLQIHPYKNSQELITESDYQHAQYLILTGEFEEAIKILEFLLNPVNSETLLPEVEYVKATMLKDSNQLAEALAAFIDLGQYKDSSEQADAVKNLIYQTAIEYYRRNNYIAAQSWFKYVDGFEDTDKYYALMNARNDETTENGKILTDLIGFEDAAEIIAGSNLYLDRFLGRVDEWGLGGNWSNDHASYISFSDAGGGLTQFKSGYLPVSNRVSNNRFYRFAIEDAIHYQYAQNIKRDDWTPLWEYTIISKDIISIHNLYDNHHYTLYRRDWIPSQPRSSAAQTKGTGRQYAALELAYPLADSYIVCTSPFGMRFSNSDFHAGIDINVPSGTPIYAVGDGVVSSVDTQFSPGGGAGYYMSIELDALDPKTGNKLQVSYYHMLKPTTLKEGERVTKGQQIGYSGNSGYSADAVNPDGSRREYPAHLHFQFSNNGTNGAKIPSVMINPAWFYPDIEFKDGTLRRINEKRFIDILYADLVLAYPNSVTG